jgi:CheY-like chemotaxis protein
MSALPKPFNMLVVEDNPGDAVLFQAFFQQHPRATHFHIVTDGEEALEFVFQRGRHRAATRPDLIVVDLNIPKVDGKNVLRAIKLDPRRRTIPVIVMTSSESEEDIRRCYEYGANCVLIKSADVEQAAKVFGLIEKFWVNSVRLAAGAPARLENLA